jgi:hypothetical protein
MMPRFFIDTDDGDRADRDEEGYDLPDAAAARVEAIGTLPDLARAQIPDGDRRTFTVRVRDAGGALIYEATLTLEGRWLGPEPGTGA